MRLTNNFTLLELTKSETASRFGLDNTPGEKEVANLKLLCEKVLQPIRDHFQVPVMVNSGYRSAAVNRAVGGSNNSDHTRGQAADIEIANVANPVLAQWIRDNLDFTQLILEFYTPGVDHSGWVHVSYDPDNLKKQPLTATRIDGRVRYLAGLVTDPSQIV